MQRYNTFNQIHKALRALLYDTALCLQQTDFWKPDERNAAVEKVVSALHIFEEHAANEDAHILPAIEMFEPAIVDAFEQEHVTDLQLGKALEATIANMYHTKNETERMELGKRLKREFVQFLVFNLNHMAKEEEVLNNLLWRYYSDDEIKNLEAVIIKNTPPEKMGFVARWMLRGISNSEAVTWLKGLEQTAPPAVFQRIFALAKTELSAGRFAEIAAFFQPSAVLV